LFKFHQMNQSRSLLKSLSILVNVIWYAELVASVLFIGAVIIGAIIRKQFLLMIPINFSTINLRQFKSSNNVFPDARLDSNTGHLVFHINTTWLNVVSVIMVYAILIGFIIAITFQIRKIFLNFKNGNLFNKINIHSIRIISFLIIVFPFTKWLICLAMNQLLTENLRFKHFELLNVFSFGYLLTGLVLFSIVEIFRLGTELEEEQKLTV